MPEVVPILIPQLNWKDLISASAYYLDRPVTRAMDARGIKPNTPKAFLLFLKSFSNAADDLKDPFLGRALAAVSIGFLISGTPKELRTLSTFRRHGTFTFAEESKATIWIENLEDWFAIMLENFGSLQEVHNKLFLSFESAGFRDLWKNFRKTSDGNGIFLLENR